MMKRVFLFIVTNLAITVAISLVLSLLGIGGYRMRGGGLDYTSLMAFCFIWGMGGAFISLQISRWSAKRMMGVQLVDGRTGHDDADWVFRTVQRLTQQAQLPMPEVGIYESPEVNAFATGPSQSRSLVAVSSGLLRAMRRDEAEAVLAHEVSHIKNGDMVTMTLIQGVVNAFVMFLARVIAFAAAQFMSRDRDDNEGFSYGIYFLVQFVCEIVFMVLGTIVVAWFSRWREFRADAGGAQIGGRERMIGALEALQRTVEIRDPRPQEAVATLKISNPNGMMRFFMTHPPLEERIARLRAAA